ncbi:MAG: hypothetical protein WD739_07475 [Actinomycetota bacterium]
MKVVGLDLSLRATGIADWSGTRTIGSRLRGVERLSELEQVIVDACADADLVVLENYAFSARSAHAHELGELGGVIRLGLWREQIHYVDVAPATLKKFATGKGNADKGAMLAAAIRRFEYQGSDHNQADALMLREMGLAQLGGGTGIAYSDEAIAKVSWPEEARA